MDNTALLYTPAGWCRLHIVVRRLITIRLLRSIAQGALMVCFVLFLRELKWSAASIGSLLGASGMVGGLLIMVTGPLSDRFGRRRFLLGYECLSVVLTGLMLAVPCTATIAVAGILLSFGRGANGAAGPFSPVEQSWLSRYTERAAAGRVFSLSGAVGGIGMGIGSFIAGMVPRWSAILPGARGYLPLFWLVLLASLVSFLMMLALPDEAGPTAAKTATATAVSVGDPADEKAIRRRENRSMVMLAVVNSINALGIGLFSPLLPLWFATRFGATAASLGSVYGLSGILSGLSSIITGEMADRHGLVKTVVWVRLAGVLMLVAMPLVPSYTMASALYIVRSLLNRGSAGARQAFGVNLVRKHRRGLASSVNALSMRLPSSVGPAVAGWLTTLGYIDLPLFVAAGLQLVYVFLFAFAFREQPAASSAERVSA